MKSIQQIQHKIYTPEGLLKQVNAWRVLNKTIVFTTGIFDILRKEDITFLNEAASYGDILIVAILTNASIKSTNSPTLLVNDENTRALLLACLVQIDAVVIFEDGTPLELIRQIMPNVMVNMGDNTIEQIVGAKDVLAAGGELKTVNIM